MISPSHERNAAVIWLTKTALQSVPKAIANDQPAWRRVLWALRHPLQFREAYGRIMAYHEAALAISRGDHFTGSEPI